MNRPLLLSVSLALVALIAAPPPADAQRIRARYQDQYRDQSRQDQRFDGFCYVRGGSVRADSETDYWGTRRGYGRCYRGEYYVYTSGYTVAPRPPAGYVARYFPRRPDRAFFDRTYNAATLTENFEPETRSDTYYPDTRYRTDERDTRYSERPADTYSRPAEPRYDDEGAAVGQYEQSAPSDDYARDSHQPDENGYVAPYDPRPVYEETEGWQDDQGVWHAGRPRAIGWQDENGQWHEGQVQDYGWRDRYGEWHVVRDGGE